MEHLKLQLKIETIIKALNSTESIRGKHSENGIFVSVSTFTGEDREKLKRELLKIIFEEIK